MLDGLWIEIDYPCSRYFHQVQAGDHPHKTPVCRRRSLPQQTNDQAGQQSGHIHDLMCVYYP